MTRVATCHDGAAVYADAYLQLFARTMADLELLDGSEHVQRHVGNLASVVLVRLRKTAGHHVRVTNRLHLLGVIQRQV